MSVYTEQEILSSIDNIELSIQESAFDVFEATIKEYDKLSQFVEFTVFDDNVIMEGKILDEATGKNTFDGFFKKVILFIPRLLAAIAKSIASVFTKDYEQEMDENGKKATEKLNNTNDPEQLATAQQNTEAVSEGKIKFDPNKKHFILLDAFSHIKNWIRILTGVGPIMRKIRTIKDGGTTSYGTLAKEIAAIIKGEKTADEAFGLSADALFELAKDSNRVARGLRGIADEASMFLQKSMEKDYANGKDITKKAEMKDLADQLSHITKIVGTVSLFGRIAHFLGKDMGGGSFFLRKIRSKMAYDKDEDPAIMKAKTEERELKARIKANKRQIARNEDDAKRLAKKEKKLQKLGEKNQKLESQLGEKRFENDATAANINDQKEDFWSTHKKAYEESADMEVNDDNEIIDEGNIEDSLYKDDPDMEYDPNTGKYYSKKFVDSLRGRGPITKKEEGFLKKFDKFFKIPDLVNESEDEE